MNKKKIYILLGVGIIILSLIWLEVTAFNTLVEGENGQNLNTANQQYVEQSGYQWKRDKYVNGDGLELTTTDYSIQVTADDVTIGDYTVSSTYKDNGHSYYTFVIIPKKQDSKTLSTEYIIEFTDTEFDAADSSINNSEMLAIFEQFKTAVEPISTHDFGLAEYDIEPKSLDEVDDSQLTPEGYYLVGDYGTDKFYQKDNFIIEYNTERRRHPILFVTQINQDGVETTYLETNDKHYYQTTIVGDGYELTASSSNRDYNYELFDTETNSLIKKSYPDVENAATEFITAFNYEI